MICGANTPPGVGRYKKVSLRINDFSRRRATLLPGLSLVLLAGIFALRKLDDFDTWWHLAAGRWIVRNGAVPATDTLSHTVRDHPWIDLQWGFDAGIYALHGLGGPGLLVLAAAAGFALTIALVFRLVRPQLGAAGGAFLLFPVVLAAQDRFEVRPELLSFPLLAAVLMVLDSGRSRDGRGMWLLVPLMVIWVNVHALFVVGVFAILCAMAGSMAAPSRRFLLPAGASVVAVLANPYGLKGALFPLKLLSRIDGSDPVFQTIAEFRSPFAADANGISIVAYKVLFVAGALLVVASLFVGRKRRIDFGALVFFAGLAALSCAARRNIALFAVGGAPFLAQSAGALLDALPATLREGLRRRAPTAAAALVVASTLLAVSIVSGRFYRWDQRPREFGLGVIDGTFPVRAVAAAREAALPPKLYNDVAAGGYLAWDDPIGDGVFIDGRLEVYDNAFFSDYVQSMYDPARFEAMADRYGIQTVFLFHRWENRRLLVGRLAQSGVWSLVYADEVAAVFVRAKGNEATLARAASMTARWNEATRAWLTRPVGGWPYPAGRVEGTRVFARLLATLGDADGATEAYEILLTLGIPHADEIDVRLILARRFAGTGRMEQARDQARRVLAIAPTNLEAQNLLR